MDYNDNTVVIVLNLGQRVVGIVVDGVSDVLSLTAGTKTSSGTGICRDAFNRISHRTAARWATRMLILVNIEKLLNSDEMAPAQDSAASEAGVILPMSSIAMNPKRICASGFYFNFAAGWHQQ